MRKEKRDMAKQPASASPDLSGPGAGSAGPGVPRKPGRPKGTPKTGGRAKGTPNKKTAEIREMLLSLKCDPITGMARIAMNNRKPPELRGRMYSELAQYMWPKRKAIEYAGPEGEALVIKIVRFGDGDHASQ